MYIYVYIYIYMDIYIWIYIYIYGCPCTAHTPSPPVISCLTPFIHTWPLPSSSGLLRPDPSERDLPPCRLMEICGSKWANLLRDFVTMVISNHLRRMILSNKGNLTPVSNSGGSVQEAADLRIALWEHLLVLVSPSELSGQKITNRVETTFCLAESLGILFIVIPYIPGNQLYIYIY